MKLRRKVMAVGCTHGEYIHPGFAEATITLRARFKPDTMIHLGDAFDTQAFRTGAQGTSDESHPVGGDIDAGIAYLKALKPHVFCVGNHEQRLFDLANHHNAIKAAAASMVLERIVGSLGRNCITVPYSVFDWYALGGYKYMHGFLFSENYLRDTAESQGSCVIAHAHRPGMAMARNSSNAIAYGVGTGCDVRKMRYACNRRQTLAWGHGVLIGWHSDTQSHLQLHTWPQGETEWALPQW